MIDSFAHSHPAIHLDTEFFVIGEETFDFITNTCNDQILLPIGLSTFLITPDAQFQRMAIELHVEAYLRAVGMASCPIADRLLREIVVLHRLKSLQATLQNTFSTAGRSVALMGCMIQHKLTHLLLAIKNFQLNRVFSLGKIIDLHQTVWELEFIGASAVVRMIRLLSRLPNTIVRLPTLEEDLDRGIDLFIQLTTRQNECSFKKMDFVASVKSINHPARLDIQLIQQKTGSTDVEDRQLRIAHGSRLVSIRYRRSFQPIELQVGRTPDTSYDVRTEASDLQLLEQFIQSLTQTPRLEEQGVSEPSL